MTRIAKKKQVKNGVFRNDKSCFFLQYFDIISILVAISKGTGDKKSMVDKIKAELLATTAIIESSPHIIILFDSNFKVIDSNKAAFTFMGFESKEAMRDGFLERLNESIPEFQPDGRTSVPLSERFMTR